MVVESFHVNILCSYMHSLTFAACISNRIFVGALMFSFLNDV